MTLAKTIADRVETAASRAAVPVAVCVIDTHGNVILKHRMSGASAFSHRALRAEGLHVSAGRDANSRPASARAARPGPLPADDGGWWPVLRDGRRRACHAERANELPASESAAEPSTGRRHPRGGASRCGCAVVRGRGGILGLTLKEGATCRPRRVSSVGPVCPAAVDRNDRQPYPCAARAPSIWSVASFAASSGVLPRSRATM